MEEGREGVGVGGAEHAEEGGGENFHRRVRPSRPNLCNYYCPEKNDKGREEDEREMQVGVTGRPEEAGQVEKGGKREKREKEGREGTNGGGRTWRPSGSLAYKHIVSYTVWGECTHCFHMHCILKWVQQGDQRQQHCPMCRQVWAFK